MSRVAERDPLLCAKCQALATRDRAGRLEPCKCGGTYFQTASKAKLPPPEWQPRLPMIRLTPADRRWLRSMRISAEGLDS